MTTPRYDLHTIDYSVQGWDVIMAADMEKIDAMIQTRIIVTLGETVTPYQPLYLKVADGKWYKAQADGTKQPCFGLAVEGGILNGQIRIHRMGEIENLAWAWANLGMPIYLDPDTAGVLTQTKPSVNVQVIGYALTATKMVTTIEFIRGVEIWAFSRGATILNPTPISVIIWRAPFACIVKAVKGYRAGGTGATINARRNGADTHLVVALSLADAAIWMDGGAVQNTAYVIGDKLEIMVVSAAGEPTQIAVQIDFEI